MRWPWQKREDQLRADLNAVREQRSIDRGVADPELGDIEFNRRRAEELREKAKRRNG